MRGGHECKGSMTLLINLNGLLLRVTLKLLFGGVWRTSPWDNG